MSALCKWYYNDRDSREESEDESESPAVEDTPKLSVFDAAMKWHDSLALCGDEMLWVQNGRWTAITVAGLAKYMNFTDKRREVYGQHAANAKAVHQK